MFLHHFVDPGLEVEIFLGKEGASRIKGALILKPGIEVPTSHFY